MVLVVIEIFVLDKMIFYLYLRDFELVLYMSFVGEI